MAALQEFGGGREDKVGDTRVRRQGGRRQVGQDVDDTNLGHEVGDFWIRSQPLNTSFAARFTLQKKLILL